MVLVWATLSPLSAQAVWQVSPAAPGLRIDGHLDDWANVPAFEVSPEQSHQSTNNFGQDDLKLTIRLQWDKESLYMALEWQDDVYDIQEIRRQEAVYMAADGTRRDRMYFFDNLKFSVRRSDYDYTLWLSPRAGGDGPFSWQRLLEGYRGMEAASSAPLVAARESDGRVTMEVRFWWDQLRLEGKKKKNYPLTLIVSDSDLPGQLLEFKASRPKWIMWQGTLSLVE